MTSARKLILPVVLGMGLPAHPLAFDESLSVRVLEDDSTHVVVSGFVDNVCALQVWRDTTITHDGNHISIESPNRPPPPCFVPLDPPRPYETVAPIGVLTPGRYTVSWVQAGFFSGSTEFSVPYSSDSSETAGQ